MVTVAQETHRLAHTMTARGLVSPHGVREIDVDGWLDLAPRAAA